MKDFLGSLMIVVGVHLIASYATQSVPWIADLVGVSLLLFGLDSRYGKD